MASAILNNPAIESGTSGLYFVDTMTPRVVFGIGALWTDPGGRRWTGSVWIDGPSGSAILNHIAPAGYVLNATGGYIS